MPRFTPRPFSRGTLTWPLAALLLAACQPLLAPVSREAPGPALSVPDEVIVRFVSGLSPAAKEELRRNYAAEDVLDVQKDAERWRLPAGGGDAVLANIGKAPGVRFVQPNYRYRLDPVLLRAGAPASRLLGVGDAAGEDPARFRQWYLESAQFPAAWEETRGKGVTVAVIDSGVDPDHPDLKANLLPMIDEITAQGDHDVWNGQSYDGRDGIGHGTHVAGLIGAVARNGVGICGAAPEVKILPIKAVSTVGDTTDVALARAIADATSHGARVVNLSLGGDNPSLVLLEALNEAIAHNVTLVIAAGNDDDAINYPAAFEGAISVGALTDGDRTAQYSNHGAQLVLVAPGGGRPGQGEGDPIYSTLPGYPCLLTNRDHVPLEYGGLSGTSMATPLVSAAAALLLAREPQLTPIQVRTRLAAACRDLGPSGRDPYYGYGALDAARALTQGRRF